jgi:hypothetical protein
MGLDVIFVSENITAYPCCCCNKGFKKKADIRF